MDVSEAAILAHTPHEKSENESDCLRLFSKGRKIKVRQKNLETKKTQAEVIKANINYVLNDLLNDTYLTKSMEENLDALVNGYYSQPILT